MPLKRDRVLSFAAAAAGAVAAGAVNGLIGSGAGTVFYFVCRSLGKKGGDAGKDHFAAAMAAVLPISLLSLTTYPPAAAGDPNVLFTLILPGAAGGLLGAFLSDKMKSGTLSRIFAALTVFGGIYMILR